jgi:hypothetical protein
MKIKVGQLFSYTPSYDETKDRIMMITEIHGHNVRFMFVDTGQVKMTSKKGIANGVHRGFLRLASEE